MDINNIIVDIENNPDMVDRCIAYSEVILYLKEIRALYYFHPSPIPWENDINKKLIETAATAIDAAIVQLKEMIKINVEVKKLI